MLYLISKEELESMRKLKEHELTREDAEVLIENKVVFNKLMMKSMNEVQLWLWLNQYHLNEGKAYAYIEAIQMHLWLIDQLSDTMKKFNATKSWQA